MRVDQSELLCAAAAAAAGTPALVEKVYLAESALFHSLETLIHSPGLVLLTLTCSGGRNGECSSCDCRAADFGEPLSAPLLCCPEKVRQKDTLTDKSIARQ